MKNLLFSIVILLCSGNVSAQFTITFEDHHPSIGDQVYYTSHINPADNIEVMDGGPDQVWDFTGMEGGIQLSSWYTEPSNGTFPDDYPNAEWVEIGTGYSNGSFSTGESYYFQNGQHVSLVGQYIEGYGKVDFTMPRLLFPFPMNYGDTESDSWEATGYNIVTDQEDNRIGETDLEVDGYGTLILPHITLNNVMRLRYFSEQELDLGGFQVTFRDTILIWFSEEYSHFVASYTKSGYVDLPVADGVIVNYIRNPDDIIYVPRLAIESSTDEACAGDCVTFNNLTDDTLITNAPDVSWQWLFPGGSPATSNAENPGNICYQTPGIYDVTLEVTIDTLTFSQTFPAIVTMLDSCGPIANFNYTPIVCLGQCYDFQNTSINATSFFWTFEGAANPISEEFSPSEICYLDETGLFNVTLTVVNDNGSSTSITQQITVVNPPIVNAGPDQTIIQGQTTGISATAGNGTGNYVWQPFEDVSCFSCPATTTYPLNETTTFVVYYEQAGGCQSSDTVTVFVEESFGFGVPNSFSPNGDGINDVLYVRGSNITKMNFIVYNRYGEEMFSTNNQKVGWDGTKNGRELNAGVFGYFLEVYQTDGSRNVVTGDVTMVR